MAVNADEIVYFHVAASVIKSKTFLRELFPLQKISDHHRKIVLSLDEVGVPANYEGIRHLNFIDWLLRDE